MVTINTHTITAHVIGDRAEFPMQWLSPHNFCLMVNSKRNRGLRGFPMYATCYEGIIYCWPINDGTARVIWQPLPWRKPT